MDAANFAKKLDLRSLKIDVDKFDIDKLKTVPTNLSDLESKVNKIDIGKLKTVPVDPKKLKDAEERDVVKNSVSSVSFKGQCY